MFLMDSLIRRCSRGIPQELDVVARLEGIDTARLARGISAGRIVIPGNPKRIHQQCAIGKGCQVKINVNIGTSGTRCDPDLEEEKAQAALINGADALMDLSTGGILSQSGKKSLRLIPRLGPFQSMKQSAGRVMPLMLMQIFSSGSSANTASRVLTS